MFDLEHTHAEPAWNGLLHSHKLPPPDLFRLIKAPFLGAFSRSSDWRWDDGPSQRLSQFLVPATVLSTKKHRYLSFDEARAALQSTDDGGRHAALGALHSVSADGGDWKKEVKPFLEKAWPKEVRYQTAEASQQLADIAVSAGNDFPDAVRLVLPFLLPADRLEHLIYHMKTDKTGRSEPLAMRFPRETIELLDRLISGKPGSLPSSLSTVLEMTAEAHPALRQHLGWRRLNDLVLGL